MPRIFDNINRDLLPALCETIKLSHRADFCVGYFNLRGWKEISSYIENWSGGEGHCCRLLIGMQKLPQEDLRQSMKISEDFEDIDNQTAFRLKKKLAEEFREQLTFGIPTNEDEAGLRTLASQIKSKKVIIKLFLKHQLHAKLYLLFRSDPINPVIGYLGSSNLTFAGLKKQGELNIDVLDFDACQKLSKWFEDCWKDRWCIDISTELIQIIEESWAREKLILPYHIYLKMAYHLSQEARAGLSEFRIPRDFGQKLFEFQKAAVKIAAHHLNKRGGVLIGDVVGLGKTLMATALVRIFEDDLGFETLIICPKNLVKMWENYRDTYRMRARVLSITQVTGELPELRRFRLIVIDESHNLRNRQGKRYRAIQEYIQENESKVILLSATPYNKTYLDLSSQLRLFIEEDRDLGIRPEQYLKKELNGSETEFIRRHQCSLKTLPAFEHSLYADDWRELMRLYLVRRTRTFIQENYAETDPLNGRDFLTFEDGTRSYFPERIPRTVKFKINDSDPDDQYAKLYAQEVVDIINKLNLPRYGLGNYISNKPKDPPAKEETLLIQNLSRGGKRLMGFCRTNLFKRLESSGYSFLLSIERHILRNYIFIHAIENKKAIPVGTQEAELLDTRLKDEDEPDLLEEDDEDENNSISEKEDVKTAEDFQHKAEVIYNTYTTKYRKKFKWLRSSLFNKTLLKDLKFDTEALLDVLKQCSNWDPFRDEKLNSLVKLLNKKYKSERILVFTQFADTARYIEEQLKARNISAIASVTGESSDPTGLVWRFSPVNNDKNIPSEEQLRILIATDILSEGQNLQDCFIVINYDLPWAIIRLIQRAGRIDRIGQQSENIFCYSFLPAEGVERIIRLRERVRQRLRENAEVVGTDEAFFDDDRDNRSIVDLYNEKSGILDRDIDTEVDLASYAYEIWKNAITKEPDLQKSIPSLPSVVYSTKSAKKPDKGSSECGVLTYIRTGEGNDALSWIDGNEKSVTESQFAILKAAECLPETEPLPRHKNHHKLVKAALQAVIEEEKSVGGQLGRPSGARFRTYERLKSYLEEVKGTLWELPGLSKTIDDIYRYPLRQVAVDTLNRQLRSGIPNEKLAELVIAMREEGRLCIINEEEQKQEPLIVCSMGLSYERR
ncbi:MAG TPA: helicase-related protein [Candidatus Eremiobacteraeota bacterium]|nr:MAG: ATP-dependent helicase HepA [bacterium ADurb.Bin363]HPZ09163.1 helicase-related protein [Candidatus Eremiobacteraeota bacterium]